MPPIAVAVAMRGGMQRQHELDLQRQHDGFGHDGGGGAGPGHDSYHHGADESQYPHQHASTSSGEQSTPHEAEINSIDRKMLVSILKRRSRRARQCRSLPFSIVAYALFVWCMLLHVRIGPSHDFETGMINTIFGDFEGSVYTPSDWYTWMHDTYIPAVFAQTDIAGNPLAVDDRPLLLDYGVVLGGIRITQTRAAASTCAYQSLYDPFYRLGCHGDGRGDPVAPSSSAPFLLYNETAAAEWGVTAAFTPSTVDGDSTTSPGSTGTSAFNDGAKMTQASPAFNFYLSAYDDTATSQGYIESLQALGWTDRFTSHVRVTTSVVNPDIGYTAYLRYDAQFTRGGRISTISSLRSMSIDTYSEYPGLEVLDAIIVFYTVYLLVGTVKRCIRILITKGSTTWTKVSTLLSWGALLDWGTIAALIAVFICWTAYAAEMWHFRTVLGGLPTLLPSAAVVTDDGTGDDAAAAPFPPLWAAAEQALANAADAHAVFKESAVYALIFLTLRLFKYVAFQARLAVLTRTMIAAFDDMLHFGVLFAIIMLGFGIWGHFAFGPQVATFKDTTVTIMTLWRIIMYEYDLDSWRKADPATADFFYASFMMLVTNLMLWMLLAVIFENYTLVRTSAGSLPSFKDEITAYFQAMPYMLPPWLSRMTDSWGCCSPTGSSGGCFSAACGCCCGCGTGRSKRKNKKTLNNARGSVTWAEVIAVCTKGPLKKSQLITPEQLRVHLGISDAVAHLLIADVAASSSLPEDSYYGHDLAGSQPLPDVMRSALENLYPHLFAGSETQQQQKDGGGSNKVTLGLAGFRAGGVQGYSSRDLDVKGEDDEDGSDGEDDDSWIDPYERENPSIMRKLKRVVKKRSRHGMGMFGSFSNGSRTVINPMSSQHTQQHSGKQGTSGAGGAASDAAGDAPATRMANPLNGLRRGSVTNGDATAAGAGTGYGNDGNAVLIPPDQMAQRAFAGMNGAAGGSSGNSSTGGVIGRGGASVRAVMPPATAQLSTAPATAPAMMAPPGALQQSAASAVPIPAATQPSAGAVSFAPAATVAAQSQSTIVVAPLTSSSSGVTVQAMYHGEAAQRQLVEMQRQQQQQALQQQPPSIALPAVVQQAPPPVPAFAAEQVSTAAAAAAAAAASSVAAAAAAAAAASSVAAVATGVHHAPPSPALVPLEPPPAAAAAASTTATTAVAPRDRESVILPPAPPVAGSSRALRATGSRAAVDNLHSNGIFINLAAGGGSNHANVNGGAAGTSSESSPRLSFAAAPAGTAAGHGTSLRLTPPAESGAAASASYTSMPDVDADAETSFDTSP